MRSIFSDVHAAGENDQNYFLPPGKKLCEAFLTVLRLLQNAEAFLEYLLSEVHRTEIFIRKKFCTGTVSYNLTCLHNICMV